MPLQSVNKAAHPGFDTEKRPEVQNRGITGHQSINFFKKICKNFEESLFFLT